MRPHLAGFLCASMLLLLATACTRPQNPDELREKTARATADAKRDARAVAEGIREGWSRDRPLDLNSATKEDLLSLPGMTPAAADRVVEGRPYREPAELVSRHILTKAEYDQISDRVTAKR